ncbi:hypothetical protein V6L77_03660 [Pannonibacter sp. Pt2-lr]
MLWLQRLSAGDRGSPVSACGRRRGHRDRGSRRVPGQAPKAFVKLRAGATVTQEEMRAFLKDHLSAIELPREIEFRDALPKTMVGKLSKKELVEEEAAKRAAAAASKPAA